MAVSVLDSTTTGNTAFASSRAVPVPTGGGPLQANDVVVVRLSRWESANPAVTAPAGFVARTQQVNGSGKVNTYLKRLTGADSGTYSFSWSGSMWTTGQAIAYRGVDPAADLATIPLHQVTNSGTAWPAATLNGVGAGALDWHGYSESGGTHTPPTSFTEVEDNDSDVHAYRLVAAGSYTTSGGASSVSSPNIVSLLHLPEASSGGGSTPAGPATETDTAVAPGRARATSTGTAAELDTAQAPGRTRTSAAGPAVELDTAQPAGRTRATVTVPGAETDVAQPAGRTRATPAGPAAETDVAQPITLVGGTPVIPAGELDTAQPVGRSRVTVAGPAAETDTALQAGRSRAQTAGTAEETDTAGTAGRARATGTAPALETDQPGAAINPNEIVWDLLLVGAVEPGRYRCSIEPGPWAASTDPDRWRTEVGA